MGQLPSNNNQLSSLQQSLFVVQKLKSQLAEIEQAKTEPIAIIGMSCRFPGGANDPEAFWQLLHDGVDAITEVPAQRWSIDSYYDSNKDAPGKMYTRSAGFLQQIDQFDPEFFGISAREAINIDPQQRLLLEVSWEALENAGQPPNHLTGTQTGIFVGIGQNDYANLQMKFGEPTQINAYTGTGNGFCFASGRLSYVLGLQGPNMAIDTACSSSLVAVHLACQSLRTGECNLALAGGVQLILSPEVAIFLSKAHALSPDGRCKTFDAAADGFGRGEGCGVVVLKRLSDAVADKNQILAVIRGSAVNHDGPSSGLTVPNGLAQQKLIRDALRNSKVEPSQVSFVETHGTGTALGDPIEIEGLGTVFGKGRSQNHPLTISSVKTNIGHLEAAAGIAGLIKVVLALQHQEIPPHLHFKQPNPHISWDELPVAVPTEPTPWPAGQRQRLAGVSSFGISGTNAHVVLEEASALQPVPAVVDRPLHLLTLSAKTQEALVQLVNRYEQHLSACSPSAFADICFTANSGRSHFQHRLSVVAASTDVARAKLAAFTAGEEALGVFQGRVPGTTAPKVAFLFTGQGAQYVGMGRQLYETEPTFRAALDRCDEILRPYLDKPLLEVLYPEAGEQGSRGAEENGQSKIHNPQSTIDETAYTQPALFALEYALFQLWKSWGITPNVVMGHSVGEYVAACVAGVFSLEDGLKLIASRGRLMQALPQDGEMVALLADPVSVAAALEPYASQVAIAAVNGPQSLVISGERQAVRAICAALEAQGVKTKRLQVSHAFHSPLMQPMLEEFRQVVSEVTFSPPQLKLASNLTGQLVSKEIATPEYWCQHILNAVQFAASLKTLDQQGYEVFVEIGPKPTLLGMGRQCLPEEGKVWLPTLRPGQADWQSMLESLAQLYVRGVSIDWRGFDVNYTHRLVPLPTYPFQRQRYWVETSNNGHVKAESLSQEDVQTPIFNLLAQGDTHQLAQYVQTAEELSPQELELLPKLLEVLVKQHQKHRKAATIKDWLYQIEWQHAPRQVSEISFQEPGSWLILADIGGVGQALADLLQERGQSCLVVYAGESYQAKEPGTWSLNPSNPGDFQRLIQEAVATRDLPLRGVVHLWSQDAELTPLTIPALEHIQVLGCGSTLHLVQALVNHYQSALPRLWLVTRGAVPVTAVVPGVAQAPLWGLGKVMALEHPELWGGLLDLEPDADRDEAVNLLAEMVDSQGEDHLAFREGQRYVARLVRSQLPVAPAVSLQSDRTYLITGGLGALGLKVAEWMVAQGVRHLVLTGRREATGQVQAAIASMQQAGVQVLVARADVANHQDMVHTLEQVKASMPPLRGIVHAAGVLDDGILLQQNWERFAKVMAPKVLGTWNLHVLTQEIPLDFLVTFSSTSALLGSPGQGNYAAANAFMDALAHYRSNLGLPGLSINWGPWSDAGMAASLDRHNQARLAVQGMQSIPLEQGLSVLKQLLGQSSLQVGVLPVDWSVLRQQLSGGRQLPLLSQLLASVKPQEESEQLLAKQKQRELLQRLEAAPLGNRHSLLINHIQSEVAKVLMCDSSRLPDPQQGLFDMGMDSLMAVELKNRLDASLGCSLPATLVFESPTIKAVAEYIGRKVLGWNSPATDNGKLAKAEEERALALSEVKQLAEDEVEASIAQELAGLETLLRGN